MTAWLFVITPRDSRTVVGAGLIALEARYIAASYVGAPRLDRRFASVDQWREIRHAFSVGLPTSPLPSAHPLAAVVLGDNATAVHLQWLTAKEVEIDAPENAVTLLDHVLIQHTATLAVPTQQVG
jgi:hypothetical protein